MPRPAVNATESCFHYRLNQVVEWVLGFHGSATQVARGMAIGVFVAFTPLWGFQMIVAFVVATLTHSSRAAAVSAVWITNPFTILPIYLSTYRLGLYVTPSPQPLDVRQRLMAVLVDENGQWFNLAHQVRELASLGSDVLVPLFIGGFVLGGGAGLLAYVATRLTIRFGKQRLFRRRKNRGRERGEEKV